MTESVHDLQDAIATRYAETKGPLVSHHLVVVEGRRIPRLTMRERGDDATLVLDDRLAIDLPKHLFPQVAWLVANALAIGEGYPFLGALTKDHPFAPEIHFVGVEGVPSCSADVLQFKPGSVPGKDGARAD